MPRKLYKRPGYNRGVVFCCYDKNIVAKECKKPIPKEDQSLGNRQDSASSLSAFRIMALKSIGFQIIPVCGLKAMPQVRQNDRSGSYFCHLFLPIFQAPSLPPSAAFSSWNVNEKKYKYFMNAQTNSLQWVNACQAGRCSESAVLTC